MPLVCFISSILPGKQFCNTVPYAHAKLWLLLLTFMFIERTSHSTGSGFKTPSCIGKEVSSRKNTRAFGSVFSGVFCGTRYLRVCSAWSDSGEILTRTPKSADCHPQFARCRHMNQGSSGSRTDMLLRGDSRARQVQHRPILMGFRSIRTIERLQESCGSTDLP